VISQEGAMKDPLLQIPDLMKRGKTAALARIIRQVGSAPRSVGTRCLILDDGSLVGTIGGGRLEHEVLLGAKEALKSRRSMLLHFELTGKDVAETEMLCGGIVDVFIEPLAPEDEAARDFFGSVQRLASEGRKGALLTLIQDGLELTQGPPRLLVREDAPPVGDARGFPQRIRREAEGFLKARRPELLEGDGQGPPVFLEPIRPDDVLYLFGAGHISTFVAPLAKMAGFRVVVIDDREEFANRQRFPNADEILVSSIPEAFEKILLTPSSYLAIVTRGHIHDHAALKAALQRDAAYIGMIGSKRKRDLIYKSLMKEGFAKERIRAVHSPIGLDIGAETPEEIAISIVAELIKVRAEKEGSGLNI
jgi:xanthine dehydrogenase accessory factor